MKAKNLLILIIMSVFTFTSCELTELEDNLTNPNAPSEDNLDVDFLYNTVQLNFPGIFVTSSDLTMRATRMMAMGGNIYDNSWSQTEFNGIWFSAYSGLLVNIDALIPEAEAKELWNYIGMAKTYEAYTLMTLVDLFGDVPYSEALQGTNVISPIADPQEQIYATALSLLDQALVEFDKGSTVWPPTEIIYGGNTAQWKKLVNTLKLRYALQTRLVDGSSASMFQSIINSGEFIQAGDDFIFEAGNTRANPNSRHPYYNEHYEASNGRYMSNYYMWLFRDENGRVDDPRRRYYFYRQNWDYTSAGDWNQFTLDFVNFNVPGFIISGKPGHYGANQPYGMATTGASIIDSDGYLGREHGNNDGIPPDGQLRTNFGVYPAGGKFDDGNPEDPSTFSHVKNNGVDGAQGEGIGPIMLASYVYFMRAEAALTMGTGEDARSLYESGIRESISYVLAFAEDRGQGGGDLKPDSDAIEAYVTKAMSDYDNASDKLNAVMLEWYKAAWTNGLDMYNAYRRTGFPSDLQPTRDPEPGNFPRSMFYPAIYVNSNQNATQKSLPLSQQVFWDTNSSFPEK